MHNTSSAIVLAFLTLLSTYAIADPIHDLDPGATDVISLWPDKADAPPYEVTPAKADGVIRLTGVANPTLAVYPAKPGPEPMPAVLVCPGGGYRILAYNKEGTSIAEWLNSIGVSAAVLKYTVPDNRDAALQDAQRAMGILRQRAAEWNIDPNRVGVLGFSAGGHLSARLSTNYRQRIYPRVDGADDLPCKPDFSVLVYPAYIAATDYTAAPEIPVDTDTPPAFVVQAQDDTHYINSGIAYYLALKAAKVPAELHLFPVGGHGYGLGASDKAVSNWPALCARWMKTAAILP